MGLAYTYEPLMIGEEGKDRMRMELGDTIVSGGENTAALSDEEYESIIKLYVNEKGKSFSYAKFKCAEAIFMKLSYEVNTGIGSLSYQFGERADRWKELYYTLKKSHSAPSVNPSAIGQGCEDGGHYFRRDMLSNPRSVTEPGPFGSKHE